MGMALEGGEVNAGNVVYYLPAGLMGPYLLVRPCLARTSPSTILRHRPPVTAPDERSSDLWRQEKRFVVSRGLTNR